MATRKTRNRKTEATEEETAIGRLAGHEAMCEERSKTIFNRLDKIDERLEAISRNGFVLALALISGMAGLIITLVTQ